MVITIVLELFMMYAWTERLCLLLIVSNSCQCISRMYLIQPSIMSVGLQKNKHHLCYLFCYMIMYCQQELIAVQAPSSHAILQFGVLHVTTHHAKFPRADFCTNVKHQFHTF